MLLSLNVWSSLKLQNVIDYIIQTESISLYNPGSAHKIVPTHVSQST